MWLDLGPPPRPTGRFRYTTYRLRTGTLTVYSISTKAHTSWLRNSFSCNAVADICCLRQQDVIFHYFHNLPLSQKLDPRLTLVVLNSAVNFIIYIRCNRRFRAVLIEKVFKRNVPQQEVIAHEMAGVENGEPGNVTRI